MEELICLCLVNTFVSRSDYLHHVAVIYCIDFRESYVDSMGV